MSVRESVGDESLRPQPMTRSLRISSKGDSGSSSRSCSWTSPCTPRAPTSTATAMSGQHLVQMWPSLPHVRTSS